MNPATLSRYLTLLVFLCFCALPAHAQNEWDKGSLRDFGGRISARNATDGQALVWDAASGTWQAGAAGISDVVDDTTPTLGGPLDAAQQTITGVDQLELTNAGDTAQIYLDCTIDTMVDFNSGAGGGAGDATIRAGALRGTSGSAAMLVFDANYVELQDDFAFAIGNSLDGRLVLETEHTNDAINFHLGAGASRTLIISDAANASTDLGLSAFTDPTLVLTSATAWGTATDETLQLSALSAGGASMAVTDADAPVVYLDGTGDQLTAAKLAVSGIAPIQSDDSFGAGLEDVIVYNADGTAMATFDSSADQLLVVPGSVLTTPGLAFLGITDTGISADGANFVIYESGTEVLDINILRLEFRVPSNFSYSWSSATNNQSAADTVQGRLGAGQVYIGRDASDSTINVRSVEATLADVSADATADSLIPAGVTILGVTCKVTTAITTSGASDTFNVGLSGDDNAFGADLAGADGTASTVADFTVNPNGLWSASAQDVIIDGTGAETLSTGAVTLTCHYIDLTASAD